MCSKKMEDEEDEEDKEESEQKEPVLDIIRKWGNYEQKNDVSIILSSKGKTNFSLIQNSFPGRECQKMRQT